MGGCCSSSSRRGRAVKVGAGLLRWRPNPSPARDQRRWRRRIGRGVAHFVAQKGTFAGQEFYTIIGKDGKTLPIKGPKCGLPKCSEGEEGARLEVRHDARCYVLREGERLMASAGFTSALAAGVAANGRPVSKTAVWRALGNGFPPPMVAHCLRAMFG